MSNSMKLSNKESKMVQIMLRSGNCGEFSIRDLCDQYYEGEERRPKHYYMSMAATLRTLRWKFEYWGAMLRRTTGIGRGAIGAYSYDLRPMLDRGIIKDAAE